MAKQTFHITAPAFGGMGIAHQEDGKVCFIPSTVPGDIVTAQYDKQKKRYNTATLDRIQTPSPYRQTSQCPSFPGCGGCPWHDISTEQALVWKQEFLNSALQRLGKLSSWPAPQLIRSQAFGWRHRIRVITQKLPDGSTQLCYRRFKSHDLIPMRQCPIATPQIQAFCHWWHKTQPQGPEGLSIELQECGPSHQPQVLVSVLGPATAKVQKLLKILNNLPLVAWAGSIEDIDAQSFYLVDEDEGLRFYIQAGQFYQLNRQGNQKLRRQVLDFSHAQAPNSLLDAYSGSGNLSLALAKSGIAVDAVEGNPRAVAAGRYSATQNNITVSFIHEDVRKYLKTCLATGKSYDLIILDPPRSGLDSALTSLLELSPKACILIGCEPNHFARDLGALCRAGYEIKQLILADFFPGSFHFESVAMLVKTA